MKKSIFRTVLFVVLLGAALYGAGRLYFRVTDGFRIAHITSTIARNPKRDTRPLSKGEADLVGRILSQPFTYLDKGCQSYVFVSEDGNYVLKFVKYKRFRPQFYNYWLSFIPSRNDYLQRSLSVKQQRMEELFQSWKLVFDRLPAETGLVYVHTNKTDHLNKQLKIVDKVGFSYMLDMDQMEFLIQKKVDMLCPALDQLMAEEKENEAKTLLNSIQDLLVMEYRNGIADMDDALMQNTGVFKGKPIHIDVGQFVSDESIREKDVYHQELFNKYYKFRLWLAKNHPSLKEHVDQYLYSEMGERLHTLPYTPRFH